jgi:ABC-type multidrug transport system fused ATPase/permease subunit
MATLKKKISEISDDTESLVKDYLKHFSIGLTRKLAIILGVLATGFILSLLVLIIVLFCSIALAVYLNGILAGEYIGFWIISGLYLLISLVVIIKVIRTKTPLFANIFSLFISTILNIETDQEKNLKGIRLEDEHLKNKIETSKEKMKSNFELLKYAFIEEILSGFFKFFTSNDKNKKPTAKSAKTTEKKKAKAAGKTK